MDVFFIRWWRISQNGPKTSGSLWFRWTTSRDRSGVNTSWWRLCFALGGVGSAWVDAYDGSYSVWGSDRPLFPFGGEGQRLSWSSPRRLFVFGGGSDRLRLDLRCLFWNFRLLENRKNKPGCMIINLSRTVWRRLIVKNKNWSHVSIIC